MFRSWGKRPPVAGTAADIARTRRSSDWKRLSAGAGTKGPRLHDWCYLELADLEAEPFNSANDGLWTRGLLIRRCIADGDLAFFTTWCPAGEKLTTDRINRWRNKLATQPKRVRKKLTALEPATRETPDASRAIQFRHKSNCRFSATCDTDASG
jgi:SRSO17 transposase